MPSLEIAVAQPGFQNHLCTLRAQTPLHSKVISSPFTFGIDKKLSSSWKSSERSKKTYFSLGNGKTLRSRLVIQAVATFEAKTLVHNENGHMSYDSSKLNKDLSPVQLESSSDDSSEMDEKEKLRRMRISKANKGNTPWNKGRKHSPETLRLIKERTRLAMQDPKVKMKLVNLGHAQTKETRTKIGIGVRMGWEKRRKKLLLQENCCYEWQNLIAEASRRGYDGEEELQWDSYKILDGKLTEEYIESVEQRKTMRRPKGSKRAPKSLEQRRKISQAISAKWNDPEYRDRVCSALSKYYDASYGAERKPRKRSPSNTESPRRSPTKKKEKVSEEKKVSRNEIKQQKLKSRRSKGPMYKDPLASSKMEMIKNIRAQRAATETKKTEAIERARLLIAEAEKAAMALEASATRSPVARASLIETRQLIAEAIRSIESIDTMQSFTRENEESSVASDEMISQSQKENWFWGLTEADDERVNGTRTYASHKNEMLSVAPNELCSLIEKENGTWGLAEADNGKVNGTPTYSTFENPNPLFTSDEVHSQIEKETDTGFGGLTEANNGKVNGTQTLSSVKDENVVFDKFTLQDMLRDEVDVSSMSSDDDDALLLSSLEQSGSSTQLDEIEPNETTECNKNLQLNETKVGLQGDEIPSTMATVTKKWVRGRLVEVPEEA
ncbi:uncharacterized protein LOC126798045 [Argentina anserina]|uniref:uncharacterized protein LOC126798045 n=1 Tax=Argentina anserina TaxID=57926 RepID=UPI0021769323|nr:uncharacterized protein LOC126798045 [Potentilla anserina]